MDLWIGVKAHFAQQLTPIELVELRTLKRDPNPPQAISSVGVSHLTDTGRWREPPAAGGIVSETKAWKLRVGSVSNKAARYDAPKMANTSELVLMERVGKHVRDASHTAKQRVSKVSEWETRTA